MESFIFTLFFIFPSLAFSYNLTCKDENRENLSIDNNLALNLKDHTENRYEARVYIEGLLVEVLKTSNKHIHFTIDLDPNRSSSSDLIEIIYNEKYGSMPELKSGMKVTACGDYITANRLEDGYEPSPAGAIVHWVHFSPNIKNHSHGFLLINGQLISIKEK